MSAKDPVTSWLPALPLSPLNRQTGRSKVALVGASMLDKRERPPLDDPAWDVWGCNSLWKLHLDADQRLRADRWFELHPLAAQTAQELLDMCECPVPLYVLEDDLRPGWVRYPLPAVRQRFGLRSYYTCTFAYQIALALLEGYQEIGLWGVELWAGSVRERRVEFPCVSYWLGLAQGHGMQITLPTYSRLLYHEEMYGYDYDRDVKQSRYDDMQLAHQWIDENKHRWKTKKRKSLLVER